MRKHQKNPTWLMDIYLCLLAPCFILFQLITESYVSALTLIAVITFMIPVRRMVRLRTRVSKEDALSIGVGFYEWSLRNPPSATPVQDFELYWKERSKEER